MITIQQLEYSEAMLRHCIQKAIRQSVGLSESEIDVTIHGRDVVLSGAVRLTLQKRLAELIAQHFHIDSMRNEIVVERIRVGVDVADVGLVA